jgi:hypothetical protein
VAVPYLGRMILVPAALAHGFAVVGLVTGWSVYREPWTATALLVVSAALPMLLVVVPRRGDGRLPARVAVLVAVGVLAVSAAVSILLPPEQRSSMQSWNWGTGAMTCLGLAAYLSIRRTLALAAGHAAFAAAVQLGSGGGAWHVHLVLVSTLVPPLGAAQYLRFYADALRQRARAVAARLEAEAGLQDLDVVRLAGHRRLGDVRDEVEPLLEHVATGGTLPLDDARARQAQRLAARLREALVAQRRALWLPDELGGAPVTVVCSDATARAVGAGERAWLEALLALFATHHGWRAVHVVLDPLPDGSIGAVVTAEGDDAGRAAADPRVRALVEQAGGRLDIDEKFLSIDADLRARIGA